MTKALEFYTGTALPIEAFTVMGMSAKPNSENPIGQFGTGLKLSVAATLRMGGTFNMWIDGVEYEFYTKEREFRGVEQQQVMVRRRKGILSRWSYVSLPFTLNYGRNLEAWQVYRELESNTRDESGNSGWVEHPSEDVPQKGTLIRVSCPGLEEAVEKGGVFIENGMPLAWESNEFKVYDCPSEHVYYRGVRVFTLKHPSRFTYEFKPGHVKLTEDRSPENIWWMMYLIAHRWMTSPMVQKGAIYKALRYDENKDPPLFETHELNFDATIPAITPVFSQVAHELERKGFTSNRIAAFYTGFENHRRASHTARVKVELTKEEAEQVAAVLRDAGHHALAQKFNSDGIPF